MFYCGSLINDFNHRLKFRFATVCRFLMDSGNSVILLTYHVSQPLL